MLIADVNELHYCTDYAAYARYSPAVIIRMHNGSRPDQQGPSQRAAAHAQAGIRAVGLYQYLLGSVDAGYQANLFCDVVGTLEPGEFLVVDIEEGTGNQGGRVAAWMAVVHSRITQSEEWAYSGNDYWLAHLGNIAGVYRWVASYGAQPTVPAVNLWQDSDSATFPGIPAPCDCSVFNGTVDQLLELVGSSAGVVQAAAVAPIFSPNPNLEALGGMVASTVFVVKLDPNGCGCIKIDGGKDDLPGVSSVGPAIASSAVVTVDSEGSNPAPAPHGDGVYWSHSAHWQDHGGNPLVSVTGGPKDGQANVRVVTYP